MLPFDDETAQSSQMCTYEDLAKLIQRRLVPTAEGDWEGNMLDPGTYAIFLSMKDILR